MFCLLRFVHPNFRGCHLNQSATKTALMDNFTPKTEKEASVLSAKFLTTATRPKIAKKVQFTLP